MVGFKFDEIMTGTHHFINPAGPTETYPLHFSLTWGNQSLVNFLNPFSKQFLFAKARGIVTVGGLVDKASCSGSLHLLYFRGRKIRYEFIFQDDSGRPYKYVGEKRNIWPWNLHKTHVTCYGTVSDLETDKIISESVVYFPYREILPFILSYRIRFGSVFRYPYYMERTLTHFKALSKKDARIIAAMAGGIIPKGGKSFDLGAADLVEKWLPRTDRLVSRMPIVSRFGLRLAVKFLNYFWPARYMRRLRPLTDMTEKERTALFHKIETSGSFGAGTFLFIKILIFPAFYGLAEVKAAIGYTEKFPNNPYFESLKD